MICKCGFQTFDKDLWKSHQVHHVMIIVDNHFKGLDKEEVNRRIKKLKNRVKKVRY